MMKTKTLWITFALVLIVAESSLSQQGPVVVDLPGLSNDEGFAGGNLGGLNLYAPLMTCGGDYNGGEPGTIQKVVQDVGGLARTSCFSIGDRQIQTRNIFGDVYRANLDLHQRVTQKTGPNENMSIFHYDQNSRVQEISNTINGRHWFGGEHAQSVLHHSYDSIGNISGASVGGSNDAVRLRQQRMLNPDGEANVVEGPGGKGGCVAERDAAGRPREIRFDAVNSETGECGNSKGRMRYNYSSEGLVSSIEDAEGNQTVVERRDDFNRPTRVRMPDGRISITRYNNAGVVVQKQLENNRRVIVADTSYGYDIMGRIISVASEILDWGQNPQAERDVHTTRYEYGDVGENGRTQVATHFPGNNGELTSRVYSDLLGRPVREEFPLTPAVTYHHSDASRVIAIQREGLNGSQFIRRNANGLLEKTTTPIGDSLEYRYDTQGLLSSRIYRPTVENQADDRTLETRYFRDAFGRVRRVDEVSNTGSGEQTISVGHVGYDENNNLSQIGALEGARSPFRYAYEHEFGNEKWLSATIDPMGNRSVLSHYNQRGAVSRRTDARGIEWNYSYDDLGRVTEISANNGEDRYVREFAYDDRGNLFHIEERKRGGAVVGVVWDALLCDLTTRGWEDRDEFHCGSEVEMAINSIGQVREESQTVGQETYPVAMGYSPAGSVNQIDYPSGLIVAYTQNDIGLPTGVRVTQDGGRELMENVSFEYDPVKGRYSAVEYPDGSRQTRIYNNKELYMGYEILNGDGTPLVTDRVKRSQFGGDVFIRMRELGIFSELEEYAGQGIVDETAKQYSSYFRDAFGRMTRVRPISKETFLSQNDDTLGNDRPDVPSCEGESFCNVFSFSDSLKENLAFRLLGNFSRGEGTIDSFIYRNDGQLQVSQKGTGCSTPVSCEDPGILTIYVSDNNGNLIEVREGAERVLKTAYKYDPWNRLERATLYVEGLASKEIRYEYDGLNRLIRRRVFNYKPVRSLIFGVLFVWDFAEGEEFIYNGSNLIEMRFVGSANARATTIRFVYGIENSPLALIGPSGGVVYIYSGTDGSVLGVRNPEGEQQQGFLQWYKYGTFGEVTRYQPVGRELNFDRSPLLYKGTFYDPILKLNHVGGAWYDPVFGRFLTRVGSPSVGDLNLYVPSVDPL